MRLTWLLILSAFLPACRSDTDLESHGLKKIELQLSVETLAELYAGTGARKAVPARAGIGGESYEASIEAAGKTGLFSSKRSWDLKFAGTARPFWEAEEVRLAAVSGDPVFIRSLLAIRVFEAAGLAVSRFEPVFVYLNSRALGLYLVTERVEGGFFEARGIPWWALYYVERDADFGEATGAEIEEVFSVEPEWVGLEVIRQLARTMLIADDEQFETAVFRLLDRTSVAGYMAASLAAHHWDGFHKNIHFLLEAPSSPLKLIPWDFDLAWTDGDQVAVPWVRSRLFVRLGRLPSVAAEVRAKLAELRRTVASNEALEKAIDRETWRIADAFRADPVLSGNGRSLETEVEALKKEMAEWEKTLTVLGWSS